MTDKLYKYIFLAVTFICIVFSILIPVLFIPFAIIGSAFFAAVVTMDKGLTPILYTVIIFIAALVITNSVTTGFLIMSLFLPLGVSLGISMTKKLNLNKTASISIVVSIIFVLIILLFFVFEHSSPFSIEEAFAPIVKNIKDILSQSYDLFLAASSDTGVSVGRESFIEGSYRQIALSMPYYITVFILLIFILSFWLLKFILKGLSINVSHMGAFTTLTISKTGAVIYFICALLSVFMSTGVASIVLYNFVSIMTIIFAYAGLSMIGYFLNMKSISKPVRIVIYSAIIIICLIPFGFSSLVALVGIADSYYQIRKRMAGGSQYL